jgi:tetratricopeptide (TPR) repeat protein
LKPAFAEAHNNLGNTLKELGRLEEAEASYSQAITVKPDYAEAHSNLGVMLQELVKLDEALAIYKKAITLKPDFYEAHSNLGITLLELGRLDEAEASCRQAITLKPAFAEAHNNLGNTLKELGRLDEAEASYTQTIALKSDFAKAHFNLGVMLQELGRPEEAEASLRQAIALKPDYAEAHYNLGLFFSQVNEIEKAVEQFKSSNYKLSKSYLLRCLYQLDLQSRFFDELDYLINQGEVNSIIGSLGCRSKLKYGLERPNLFCKNPLKYVLHTDLNSQYDFGKIFVEKARAILNENKISYRKTALLINGHQTSGNLFNIKSDFTERIQKVIRLEIEKYRITFKNSEEGLIKKWPTDYSIYGWLISMKSGGELRPHMHEQGWISGSIYINVPSKLKIDSGNLVVCIDDGKSVTESRKNSTKSINVVTGNLVLFPASLMHYTIPFKSEEERIVLAFDVISK